MTTRKRKSVLPELTWLAATGGDGGCPFRQATRELRAAEAVIRAARRIAPRFDDDGYPEIGGGAALDRALARLDKLTRPTRRTP